VRGAKETKDDDGTRAYTQLEYIAIYMEEHDIDMYSVLPTGDMAQRSKETLIIVGSME
jgi:hypothetical protein